MMSKYDPWVNMLRTTVAAFGAGIGGADSVTVVPFDSPLGEPDALRSPDRAQHLAAAALRVPPRPGRRPRRRLVRRREADRRPRPRCVGGARADRVRGRGRVRGSASPRPWPRARRGRGPPDAADHRPHRVPEPRRVAARARPAPATTYAAGVPPFEELRDQPATSPVFLATMGPVAAHTARAGFATNLFAAGGVAVAVAGPTDGVESVLAAYDGQPVVCLAGPDAAYAEWGADLVAALRDAGARHVVVAGQGRRRCRRPVLRRDGRAGLPAPDEGGAVMSVPESVRRAADWSGGEGSEAGCSPSDRPAGGALDQPRGHRHPPDRTARSTSRASTRSTPGRG